MKTAEQLKQERKIARANMKARVAAWEAGAAKAKAEGWSMETGFLVR